MAHDGVGTGNDETVQYVELTKKVYDAKWSSSGKFPAGDSLPARLVQRWMPYVQRAIDKLPDGPLKEALLNAMRQGEVTGQYYKTGP